MKELEQHIKKEVPTEQMEQKKVHRYYGALRPQPGQKCYQIEVATGEVKLAVFHDVAASLNGKVTDMLRLKDGYMYCCAININSAKKKFGKLLKEKIKLALKK